MKSLVDLIDESLAEIEELKKSDRFSASEITLGDSDSGVKGKDKNGSLGKEDAEKADDDAEKADDDMDKGEGKNRESDPNGGNHKAVCKADDDDDDKDDDKDDDDDDDKKKKGFMDNGEGQNRQADPNGGSHKPVYKSDEPAFEEELTNSRLESEARGKSYIDEKVGGLEATLAGIADAVKELAGTPVPSKGASYKDVSPLQKSEPEVQALSKTEVVGKLFELKKSGTTVDTMDITSAELGSASDVARIVNKYSIK